MGSDWNVARPDSESVLLQCEKSDRLALRDSGMAVGDERKPSVSEDAPLTIPFILPAAVFVMTCTSCL